jgi:phage tail sheath protein FI
MPEYLAPAVYVEEVDTGSKPIEGVSTSTSGFVGVTERGPVNVPILLTSNGEFQRWFGQTLNPALYGDHRFLPHAVEGFFVNGGKRVFVTRVLEPDAASLATTTLFEHQPGDPDAILLARSPLAATTIEVTGPSAIATSDWLRIGTGSDAEYRQVDGVIAPAASTTVVLTGLPLSFSHAAGTSTAEHYPAPLGAPLAAFTLQGDHPAGGVAVTVAGAGAISAGQLLQINDFDAGEANEELIYVQSATPIPIPGGGWSVLLRHRLQRDHLNAAVVNTHAALAGSLTTSALSQATAGGDVVMVTGSNAGFALSDVVQVLDANPDRTEVRRIGELHEVDLGTPLAMPLAAGATVDLVSTADDGAVTVKTLDALVAAGTLALNVNDRQGLSVGQPLRIGQAADVDVEYVFIRALPDQNPTGPDPGRIVLWMPLTRPHGGVPLATRQIVQAQTLTATPPNFGSVVHPAVAGVDRLLISGPLVAAPAVTDLIRIERAGVDPLLYRIQADNASVPQTITLASALLSPHVAPQPVFVREQLFDVFAFDPGQWGNRLRVAARRETTPLVRSRIRMGDGIQDPTHIRLESAGGVEVGTILSLADAAGAPIDTPFKVTQIDRGNGFLLTIDPMLPAAAAMGSSIVSIEFALSAYLLRQADPAQPVRNTQILDAETFRHLSLDPRHSRYIHRVIGTTWVLGADEDRDGRPLRRGDRRSEGESAYIRVSDRAQFLAEPARTTELHSIRIGPEFLVDILPDGRREPARRALAGGDDQIGAITDFTYIGIDDPEPDERTGLQTLRNIEEISIVAVPGRTSAQMQGALIAHCELMRYRFAVLDGLPPPGDSMTDIQVQRQQFDTKYAALYHPWLLIPDPYPPTPAAPPDYPIPPAGHTVGIYARTDIDRGVHKAPANEVVRGVIGLQRVLNKEQHDILNPYPVNINVIRDFRPNNRGIRVYGGRCITSDSDWKYVNVRRLLIFIEASIDRGLQWVVFEPNAEPLWARVRRSITNFLTTVWRNGALEGTKPEEAFFVKCDRTTMTQTDIDQGRLICLVGVAPVKPAEFVIVRIGLWTAHAEE